MGTLGPRPTSDHEQYISIKPILQNNKFLTLTPQHKSCYAYARSLATSCDDFGLSLDSYTSEVTSFLHEHWRIAMIT